MLALCSLTHQVSERSVPLSTTTLRFDVQPPSQGKGVETSKPSKRILHDVSVLQNDTCIHPCVEYSALQYVIRCHSHIVYAGSKQVGCGQCTGCITSDCGRCSNCADKKKFGGPGKKKQRCKERQCHNTLRYDILLAYAHLHLKITLHANFETTSNCAAMTMPIQANPCSHRQIISSRTDQ